MVGLYFLIKVVSSLAPNNLLEKHMVQAKKAITMKMKRGDYVQCGNILISGSSVVFLLGSYGTKGDFYNVGEKSTFVALGAVGFGCLLVTSIWKLVVIKGEMKREAEFGPESESEESANPLLTEASSFWVVIGVLATSFYSAVNVVGAVTLDDISLSRLTPPLVGLFYLVALFCQPRRNSPKDMWRLRLHFMSFAWISEAAIIVFYAREGDSTNATIHVGLATAETLIFHWGFKLRATIGRLPEKGETC
jgi:hypothetical protein